MIRKKKAMQNDAERNPKRGSRSDSESGAVGSAEDAAPPGMGERPEPDGGPPGEPESASGSQAESEPGQPPGSAGTVAQEVTEGPGTDVAAGMEGGKEEGSLGELEAIQEEMDRVKDQYLRLAADFENYRKRVSADLAGTWTRAQTELVRHLLEGLDDLQRVSQFTSEDTTVDTLIEGVDLVERKLLKALTDAGLEVIDPQGEVFDPNTMEAMMRVPVEEAGQDEMVHQVFQKGYQFKNQLVRPAKVSVYKEDD